MDWRYVTDLRKSGKLDEAMSVGQGLLARHPEDSRLRQAVGWVLYDRAKQIIGHAESLIDAGRAARLRQVLDEYARLDPDVPDLLHSRLIALLVKAEGGEDLAADLLTSYGDFPFTSDDYERSEYSGRQMEPLAETVARALGKAAVKRENESFSLVVLNIVDHVLAKANCIQPEWLHYRRGQILAGLGRNGEAAAALGLVLRRKRGDGWAWSACAAAFEEEAPEFAMAYLAKALTLPSKPEMLVNTYERFAVLAAAQGDHDLACWAATTAVETRKKAGFSIPSSLEKLLGEAWYEKPQAGLDISDRLRSLARVAEEHADGIADQVSVTFLEYFTSPKGSKLAKVARRVDQESFVDVIPRRLLSSLEPLPGDPLIVLGETDGFHLRADRVSMSEDRAKWDALDEVEGVLVSHDMIGGTSLVDLPGTGQRYLDHAGLPELRRLAVGQRFVLHVARDMGSLRAFFVTPGDERAKLP